MARRAGKAASSSSWSEPQAEKKPFWGPRDTPQQEVWGTWQCLVASTDGRAAGTGGPLEAPGVPAARQFPAPSPCSWQCLSDVRGRSSRYSDGIWRGLQGRGLASWRSRRRRPVAGTAEEPQRAAASAVGGGGRTQSRAAGAEHGGGSDTHPGGKEAS